MWNKATWCKPRKQTDVLRSFPSCGAALPPGTHPGTLSSCSHLSCWASIPEHSSPGWPLPYSPPRPSVSVLATRFFFNPKGSICHPKDRKTHLSGLRGGGRVRLPTGRKQTLKSFQQRIDSGFEIFSSCCLLRPAKYQLLHGPTSRCIPCLVCDSPSNCQGSHHIH